MRVKRIKKNSSRLTKEKARIIAHLIGDGALYNNKHNKPLLLMASKEIKREFLRALFDDEGSVRNKYSLVLYSINDRGLLQVKAVLEEFGIDSKLQSGYGCRRNVFALEIKDFKLFDDQIGFSLGRKQEKLNQFLE